MSSAISKGTLVVAMLFFLAPIVQAGPVPDLQGEWARLTREAAEMGLPSRFLRLLPLEFVKLEFADLKNVAAEYHPDGHRMVFHLNLSEGNQGKRLRSLRQIGNRDLATIYHELFHAYFDYVEFASGTPRMTPQGARLYAEAKRFVVCRYSVVEISPTATQKSAPRKGRFEKRRISEREGWDALNETWGVFVGWAMWNKLEATERLNPATRWDWDTVEDYLDRLETAYVNGELTGYFEPADQAERRGIPRWYLAPSHAISAPEVALLLEVILDETPGMARLAAYWVSASQDQTTVLTSGAC
ncbi:MAG: hypothetical protein E6K57_00030 [Nitrospirae bacterium]|nr:MAG: hypothetical protein E6K57_00030 [Nitrospirota bacterium]